SRSISHRRPLQRVRRRSFHHLRHHRSQTPLSRSVSRESMTAEQVFKYYRIYKLYYQGKFDIKKYGGHIRTPPLIQQPDRRFYWRIAQKLDDAQIHALFTTGFFYNPSAYVADLATQQAFSAAIQFASRAENGRPLLEADLYALQKRLRAVDLD